MKSTRIFLIAALSPALVLAAAAQAPPPAPPPPPPGAAAPPPPPGASVPVQQGVTATHNSRVNAVVYGPQGEIQAFTLRNGIAVSLPPDVGMRLQSSVIRGTRVQVSGIQQVIAGQTSLIAQSITTNGQTFVAAAPAPPDLGPGVARGTPPPPPPAGPQGPRVPRGRRAPGAPPPPPPDGAAPAPPDGAVPPPVGTPPPPPPQM
ncbi:hypothetical protein [Tunturibacter empetritectus]|uniref:DUF5666 domain-containing protein n=1 Tax=Tunturiibacter lichenicola TaxID=2051959 RepID=A0A7W8J9D7_9BACT|nr:hypothetical protein [Edaphobacter lichenicola]MBB5345090.1 hypothetical protein [Edaphobacter lichenicola]